MPKFIKLLVAPSLALMLAILAACGGSGDPSAKGWHGHDISGVMPELAFKLTTENGQTMQANDTLGKVRLLYFGFTSCPDICPTTLGHIKTAINSLSAEQQGSLQVLFISVDPKRDDYAKLKDYTGYFGPQFLGLTGTQEQLKAIAKRYRVTYGYGEPQDNGFYDVSHSSAIFVFDAQGKARLLMNQSLTPADIADDIQALLKQD